MKMTHNGLPELIGADVSEAFAKRNSRFDEAARRAKGR